MPFLLYPFKLVFAWGFPTMVNLAKSFILPERDDTRIVSSLLIRNRMLCVLWHDYTTISKTAKKLVDYYVIFYVVRSAVGTDIVGNNENLYFLDLSRSSKSKNFEQYFLFFTRLLRTCKKNFNGSYTCLLL